MPAFFTRGSGHNDKAQYSERPDDYVNNVNRLSRKFETARAEVPAPVVETDKEAKIGIIGYGTSHWAIIESRDQLREEMNVKTSYLRVRAYPFNNEILEFIDAHERIYIVEQNRDAQLAMLLRLELSPERCAKLRSVLHYSGLPIDARSVSDDILAQEGFEVAKRFTPASASSMTGGE
jgi:2-oxoglutarate ferredoxin oxidoreductase subunit alpha